MSKFRSRCLCGNARLFPHLRCRKCHNAHELRRYHDKKLLPLPTEKRCIECADPLDSSNWRSSSARNSSYLCKTCKCRREVHAYKKYAKPRRDFIRAEMIAAYGGECRCCGESEPKFLGIDHILGGGGKHRRELGAGIHFYRKLRAWGYPKDAYQLLCHNCNQAKGLYGACPHAAKRKAATA